LQKPAKQIYRQRNSQIGKISYDNVDVVYELEAGNRAGDVNTGKKSKLYRAETLLGYDSYQRAEYGG
jgi:hypothetical protein